MLPRSIQRTCFLVITFMLRLFPLAIVLTSSGPFFIRADDLSLSSFSTHAMALHSTVIEDSDFPFKVYLPFIICNHAPYSDSTTMPTFSNTSSLTPTSTFTSSFFQCPIPVPEPFNHGNGDADNH